MSGALCDMASMFFFQCMGAMSSGAPGTMVPYTRKPRPGVIWSPSFLDHWLSAAMTTGSDLWQLVT